MNIQADFAVIGGGGAGLAAALSAHEAGVKRIVVLEKSPFWGGNSRMAGGQMFAVETPDQYAQDKVMYKDDVFKETMQFHHYSRIQPKILRRFLENGPETIAWLESLGFPYYNEKGTNYMVEGLMPFGNFNKVTLKMVRILEEAGHKMFRNTQVTGLTNQEGIWHIEAEMDGEPIQIEARAAAITTGGFTGNAELMQKYFSDQYHDNYFFDGLRMDGDGIELARQAGAAMTDYCTLIKEVSHSCDGERDAPSMAAQQPASLWVNAYGERFHDETNIRLNEYTNAVVQQPGNMGFALFDGNVFAFARTYEPEDLPPMPPMDKEGSGSPFPPGPGGDMPPMGPPGEEGGMPPMGPPDIEPQLRREAQRSDRWVCMSEDLDEIARWMGAEPEVLRETVEEYNRDCDLGHDSLFAKEARFLIPLRKPPYYALRFQPILIDTAGPIVIDHRARVLDPKHKPLPGLFSAGVVTSGWQGVDYHLHGSALGYSVTFGRLAGKEAAAYLGV